MNNKSLFLCTKLANLGNAKAQNYLGFCYFNGESVQKDFRKAVFWFTKSAEKGNAEAQNYLGSCYDKGKGVKKDPDKAFFWFTKSAEKGNAEAQYSLGNCFYSGKSMPEDMKKALFWFIKAAEKGNAEAQYILGNHYYNGKIIRKNFKKAVFWLTKAAEQGNGKAANELGDCYCSGNGVKKNFKKAVFWFSKSAVKRNADSQYRLGCCYHYGKVLQKDLKKAMLWYTRSAKQGNKWAQNALGNIYKNGEGVPKDMDKAARWYIKSAEQGCSNAQNSLGYCYYHGKGVPEDIEKAIYWFTKSAEQGNDEAQKTLAYLYYHGEGVQADMNKAVHWIIQLVKYSYFGFEAEKELLNIIDGINIDQNQDPAKNELNSKNGIIAPDSIKPKKMFYPEKTAKQVCELIDILQGDNYKNVLEQLSNKGLRSGFTCLFSGSPGTGKTETVYQLARETGRGIVQIDISDTKSMWFGESEKKIKKVFDSYRKMIKTSKVTPILLMNEADAVISKRSRLDDDYFGPRQTENAIQNIILQELEIFEGILIATTNLSINMDKAFDRRFLYKIEFEKPNLEARKSIWQEFFPDLAEDEVIKLAGKYDFSGGQIENIARKGIITNVLNNTRSLLDTVIEYCELENTAPKKLGFAL